MPFLELNGLGTTVRGVAFKQTQVDLIANGLSTKNDFVSIT